MEKGSSELRSNSLRNMLFRFGFLSPPKNSERRRHDRLSCMFPVTLHLGSGDGAATVQAQARDISVGGMLLDGAGIPEGTIRLHAEFDLPPGLLPGMPVARHVKLSAAVRYRDSENNTASLSFAEPLDAATVHSPMADHWMALTLLAALGVLIPLSFYFHYLVKYLAVWLAGFGVTLVLTPLVRTLARRLGAVDMPDARRSHAQPTPRGGGLAVVIGFYCAATLALRFPWEWSSGSLDTGWLDRYLLGSAVLVLVGLFDDVRGLRPLVKLSGQVLAAALMFSMGQSMGSLLGFNLPLPLDFLATILWFVALTNAFNLIDGLDGLATGLALVAGIGLMGAFFIRRMPSDALVVLGLVGACFAFLRYNFHPASIFLGDTGSMFLGFTFASIAIATGSKGTFLASLGVPLLAVGIPVFDTILAVWRRSMRAFASGDPGKHHGASELFKADAEHLHHRLRRKGWSQHRVAVLLYVINASLVITGLLSLAFRDQALGIFLVAFVAGVYVVIRHLAEVELWDTGQAIVRGLNRPHRRVAAFFFYPVLDVACLIAALGLSFALLQLVVPQERPWEVWMSSIPLWVAPAFIIFCATRMYSRVWSLARANDYLILSVSLFAGTLVSTGVACLVPPYQWQHTLVVSCIYTGLAHVFLLGNRLFVRGLLDALSMWSETQYYQRGGVVHRVLLYGSGGRCLLFIRNRTLNNLDYSSRRMIVGLVDDDPNLRFRRVGGYVVLGSGSELPDLIQRHRIDEIVVTAQLRDEMFDSLVVLCGLNGVRLSEWHYEERRISGDADSPAPGNSLHPDVARGVGL